MHVAGARPSNVGAVLIDHWQREIHRQRSAQIAGVLPQCMPVGLDGLRLIASLDEHVAEIEHRGRTLVRRLFRGAQIQLCGFVE